VRGDLQLPLCHHTLKNLADWLVMHVQLALSAAAAAAAAAPSS
jgi:hypothetical protein